MGGCLEWAILGSARILYEKNVHFGSLADIATSQRNVRFSPNSGCLAIHSITWSARASSEGGTVRTSVLAVLRLMTISNLVGA